jgi:hypothetical protein
MGKKVIIACIGVNKEVLEQFKKAVLYNKHLKGFAKSTVEQLMIAYTNKTIDNFKKELENEHNNR